MYVVAFDNRRISSVRFECLPGSDSTDALVSSFCDNSPQSVYKLAKSRSRANTVYWSFWSGYKHDNDIEESSNFYCFVYFIILN